MTKFISADENMSSPPTKKIIFANQDKLCHQKSQVTNSTSADEDISSPPMKEFNSTNENISSLLANDYLNWSKHGCCSTTTFKSQGRSYNFEASKIGIKIQFPESSKESSSTKSLLNRQRK